MFTFECSLILHIYDNNNYTDDGISRLNLLCFVRLFQISLSWFYIQSHQFNDTKPPEKLFCIENVEIHVEWGMEFNIPRKTFTIKALIQHPSNPNTKTIIASSCSYLCAMHWSQLLSRAWKCSWISSYIWVINTFIKGLWQLLGYVPRNNRTEHSLESAVIRLYFVAILVSISAPECSLEILFTEVG